MIRMILQALHVTPRQRRPPCRESTVPPAVAEDVAAARDALAHARAEQASGWAQWPRVAAVVGYMRHVREVNHLADDLRILFRSTEGEASGGDAETDSR